MTTRAAAIVADAKAILTEIHGEEPDGERLALFLAAMVVRVGGGFCYGFGRTGPPVEES